MANSSAPRSSPDHQSARPICAVHIVNVDKGNVQTGRLSQIIPTADLTACGSGFNEHTVKVQIGQNFYFVFRADLERTRKTSTHSYVPVNLE